MMQKRPGLILLLALCALVAACSGGPEPRYEGPAGQGRLVFEKGRGIVRQGSVVNSDEAALYAALERAFNENRLAECIALSEQLSLSFPEGSRVVQAILLRIQARMELGRSTESKLPRGISLDRMLFLYLAPDYDPRLVQLLSGDASVAEYARGFRALELDELAALLRDDAEALYSSGQLAAALTDCRALITYYLPAQELREFRHQTAELTRNVAWLAYAVGETNAALEVADDLLALNPPPAVKGDTLYIRGHILRRNSAHAFAAESFRRLFQGSGLRDTDTRWRPYALAWWIAETMETAKGPLYDLVPYETALELVSEYELYRIENPTISKALRERFVTLADKAYSVLVLRTTNAADAYDRLGEEKARDHYLQNAQALEVERARRLARLRSDP